MNYSIIIYIIGWILKLEAAFMLLPGITAIIYREKQAWFSLSLWQSVWQRAFLLPGKSRNKKPFTQKRAS